MKINCNAQRVSHKSNFPKFVVGESITHVVQLFISTLLIRKTASKQNCVFVAEN
jgi:hypothetical protein